MIQIWGCSRTASKAYMYLLEHYSEINVTKEVHVLPSFGKYQFFKEYLKYKFRHKNLKVFANNLEQIRDASYWRGNDFDKKTFYEKISGYQFIDFFIAVKALFETDRVVQGKRISGAKFPSHIFYFPLFLKKFYKGKFILLARNPIEIYKSQINKHNVTSFPKKYMMLVWVTVMFSLTMFYVFLYRSKKNVHFIKFCMFKADRKNTIKKLCTFLNIEFKNKMLYLPKKGSSFKGAKKVISVSGFEKFFLKLFTCIPYRYYKKIN